VRTDRAWYFIGTGADPAVRFNLWVISEAPSSGAKVMVFLGFALNYNLIEVTKFGESVRRGVEGVCF
jgi:hypothetical protein